MKESEFISQFLVKHKLAEHLLEHNYSQITFEDHVEI